MGERKTYNQKPSLARVNNFAYGSESLARVNHFNNPPTVMSAPPQPSRNFNTFQVPQPAPRRNYSNYTKNYQPEQKVLDHLEESVKFLQAHGYNNLELSGSYASYMTGLQYHSHAKPENQYLYMCVSDPDNKYDANAIGVYDEEQKRLAYVPKHLAKHVTEKIQQHMASGEVKNCVLVAFCSSKCTDRSAQSIYNLYVNLKPAPQATYESESSVRGPPPAYSDGGCMCCGGVTKYYTVCQHHKICEECSLQYSPLTCPSCGKVVA